MKKQILGVIIALSAVFSATAMAEDNISVTFDGKALFFDEQPKLIDGSVMVPMRKIFEEVGADISWDAETKTVTAVKNAQYVTFTADSTNMELGVCKDGKNTGEHLYYADNTLTSAPVIVNGSMLVPARAVSEAFYYDVNWDSGKKCVEISTPNNPEGWIYYASWTDGGHMYKIDTNGQNRQILSTDDCYSEAYYPLVYNDGYIYYSKRGENEGCLYRIKTDGTGEEKLTDIPVELEYDYKDLSPFIGDCIYFYKVEKDNRGYKKYTVPLYKLNVETKELTQLLDTEIPSYSIRKYGDYIYFQYDNDRMSYYRIDADENIIKVIDNLSSRNVSIENDRLSFINERDGKLYTTALDGSDIQEVKRDTTADELLEKYDCDGILDKSDDFIVGYRLIKDNEEEYYVNYSMEYCIVNNDGKELFKITPPENADIHHGANIVGRKVYYSLTPKYEYEQKKLYVDSLDELLGMERISVSPQKVDGKYEILTAETTATKIGDFESEVHCVDLDTKTDTVILKGYFLRYIMGDEENKLYLTKETDDGEIKDYTADLDGSNIKPYERPLPSFDAVNLNENSQYGIIVNSDGAVKSYRSFNKYWRDRPYYLDY